MMNASDLRRYLVLFRAAQLRAIRANNGRMAGVWAKHICKVKRRLRSVRIDDQGTFLGA